ncbi:TPA: glycosyltransferase [Bacillus toyonensis]
MNNIETISVCIIVKNEEETIQNCLESIKDIANEIIIVDTGSQDTTIEICKKYGCNVYQYKWDYNFSNARNFSFKQASSSWILYLDADEELDINKNNMIQKYICETKGIGYTFSIINYYGDYKKEENIYTMKQIRLIKNGCNIKFEGAIHEQLKISTEQIQNQIYHIPHAIHHYGYLQPIVRKKEKYKRNMELLLQELNTGSKDPWILYYIANEYYQQQQFEKSKLFLTQASIQFLLLEKIPPSLLYKLKYDLLWITGQIEELLSNITYAIILYPDYVDLYYYQGLALYQKKQYKEALLSFQTCLKLGEENLKYLIERGVGTKKALWYQKKCLEKLEKN